MLILSHKSSSPRRGIGGGLFQSPGAIGKVGFNSLKLFRRIFCIWFAACKTVDTSGKSAA
jgi:hypothetical protein